MTHKLKVWVEGAKFVYLRLVVGKRKKKVRKPIKKDIYPYQLRTRRLEEERLQSPFLPVLA